MSISAADIAKLLEVSEDHISVAETLDAIERYKTWFEGSKELASKKRSKRELERISTAASMDELKEACARIQSACQALF